MEPDEEQKTQNKHETEPFHTGTFISIVISLFSFFFAVNVIYPIVPLMIRDFFHIPNENTAKVDNLSRYLDSAFFVGTITSSILCSRLSDVYGRRPMILIGLSGTSACAICFGLSINYYFALFVRFVWGIFNGNISIIKTILGEIATRTNQARLYAIFSVFGGLGVLCGNLVGAYLNNDDLPFNSKYQYLLPCLISSIVSLSTFIVVYCLLKETNIARKKQFFGNKLKGKVVDFSHDERNVDKIKNAMVQVTALRWNKRKYNKIDDEYDDDEDGDGGTQLVVRHLPLSDDDDDDSDNNNQDEEKEQRPKHRKEGLRPTYYDAYCIEDNTLSICDVFRKHNIWVTTIFYGFIAFLSSGYESVFIVWLQSDKEEYGLNWTQRSIATVAAIVGPIYIVYQLAFFVKFVKWKGYIKSAKINLCIYLVLVLFLPHLGYDMLRKQKKLIQMIVMCIYVSIALSVRIMCFALSILFINCAGNRNERATANGIGQTIASLNKLLAPILLTNVFSWGVGFNVWPFNYCIAFYIQAFVALIAVFWIHMFPTSDFERLCKQFKAKKKKRKQSNGSESDSNIR